MCVSCVLQSRWGNTASSGNDGLALGLLAASGTLPLANKLNGRE